MEKKLFQKTIGLIRKNTADGCDVPKAMMTDRQMKNNTATVNCGGEWNPDLSRAIADMVLHDYRFMQLMSLSDAKAQIEPVGKSGGVQIRINY